MQGQARPQGRASSTSSKGWPGSKRNYGQPSYLSQKVPGPRKDQGTPPKSVSRKTAVSSKRVYSPFGEYISTEISLGNDLYEGNIQISLQLFRHLSAQKATFSLEQPRLLLMKKLNIPGETSLKSTDPYHRCFSSQKEVCSCPPGDCSHQPPSLSTGVAP